MIASMTGFARTEGATGTAQWVWELRSVNGRGLDVKLRLPPGYDALEPGLREASTSALRRGNVGATLSLRRAEAATLGADPAALDRVLRLALDVAARIPGAPAPRAEALLALPGVLRAAAETECDAEAQAAVRAGFAQALAALAAARAEEGARLQAIVTGLLDEIAALHAAATAQAAGQPAAQRARMLEAVAALLAERPALPEERIAQEVALLAARSDVREELDRLGAHVDAARGLLAEGGAVGRRFDFLLQEFNREVNTLCSKSASVALTGTGLRLKAVVEQLREQIQNVE